MCSLDKTGDVRSDLLSHIRERVAKGVISREDLVLESAVIPYDIRCGIEAVILAQSGQIDQALTEANRILSDHPNCPDALFAKIICLSMLQQWSKALVVSDVLYGVMCDYPNSLWLRAGILRQVDGDTDPKVLAAYNSAILDDGSNLYARMERADIYRSTQNYADAKEEFVEIIKLSTEDEEIRTEAQFKLACTELVLGNMDAARALITAVLDTAPDYPDAADLYTLLNP